MASAAAYAQSRESSSKLTDMLRHAETDHTLDRRLNEAIGKWVEFVVPVEGSETWKPSTSGSPSLSDINYLELHADTWDYGFTLWLDGVTLESGR